MNKILKRVITAAVIIGSLCISAAPVFAAIPAGTVIFSNGDAYDLQFANDPANIAVIQKSVVASSKVWIKSFNNSIYDNSTAQVISDSSILPAVTYTDAQGKSSEYGPGDGDLINSGDFTVISID